MTGGRYDYDDEGDDDPFRDRGGSASSSEHKRRCERSYFGGGILDLHADAFSALNSHFDDVAAKHGIYDQDDQDY